MQNLPAILEPQPLRVVACPHPFKLAHEERQLVPGVSLSEILADVQPDALLRPRAHVWVNNDYIPPALWDSTYPAPGANITIRVVPQGGFGRTIATVVIAVAAIVTSILTYGALAPVWGTTLAGIAGGLVGMTVGIVGNLMLNALIPPASSSSASLAQISAIPGQLDYGETSPTYAITGMQNKENLYGPIPKIYGRHRMAPPYGARSYTESSGSDQFYILLFVWGWPGLEISELKIGETALSNYIGVEVEHRNLTYDGVEYGDDPITLYPLTIQEEALSVLLEHNDEHVQTTEIDTDEISVDVTCISLIGFTSTGGTYELTVTFGVYYRATGVGDYQGAGTITLTGNTKSSVRGNLKWTVERGQYDVKVIRTSGNDDQYRNSVSYWTALRSITKEDPMGNFPFPLARTAMRIKASGQLDGVVDEFTGIVQALIPDWEKDYSAEYPEAHSDTYVKATSKWGTDRWPYFATDPAKSLTGDWSNNCWLSASGQPTNQRFHIDLGAAAIISRIYYENAHNSGSEGSTTAGAKNFTFWGSNKASAFAALTYGTDTDWTEIALDSNQFEQHAASDAADPKYITVTDPETAYRYYALKIADNWGHGNTVGLRRVVLQDGGRWITRSTQNPASAFRAALQGNHLAKPRTDAQLDLTNLQAWHEYCETEGWEYNKVVDYKAELPDLLTEIAASGRAAWSRLDGLLGVIIDQPQDFAVGPVLSPRNILKDSYQGAMVYPDLPHAFRAKFINEDAAYQQDERVVLDDGYQINDLDAWGNSHPAYTPATVFEEIEFPGVTNAELIFRHARYHIATARLRPEVTQFAIDIEWLVPTRGDRIKFAHDVMLVGLSWGRVTEVLLESGTDYIAGVVLDELMPMETGVNYCLRFRLADNTAVLATVDNGADHTHDVTLSGGAETVTTTEAVGHTHNLTVTGEAGTFTSTKADGHTHEFVASGGSETPTSEALASVETKSALFATPINPSTDSYPAVGDLALFGEADLEATDLIIKSIRPNADMSAVIQAVAYDPAVYTADEGTIPEFSSNLTTPSEWWTPIISWIRSDGSVLMRDADGSWQSRILVTLFRPSVLDHLITGVECQYWVTGGDEPAITLPVVSLDVGEVSICPVEDGKEYSFRLRYVKKGTIRGKWGATQTHTVEGKTAAPSDVTGFDVYQVSSVVTCKWTAVPDLDIAGYEIRYGAASVAWDDATKINGTFQGTTFTTTEVPTGTWDFLIKAIDTSGNYSGTEASKAFQVYSFYTILSDTQEWPLWGGTLTNYIHNPRTGNLNPDDQDVPSGNDFDVFDTYVVNPYAESSYEAPEIDLGGDEAVRAWARIDSNLGPGESGDNAPTLSIDYKLAAGAYDGFEDDWGVDYLTGRYVKAKAVNDNTAGLVRMTGFQPIIDQSEVV